MSASTKVCASVAKVVPSRSAAVDAGYAPILHLNTCGAQDAASVAAAKGMAIRCFALATISSFLNG